VSLFLLRDLQQDFLLLLFPFWNADGVDRGAAFLDGPVGCAFVDKLWEETVEDVVAIDSGLALFAPRTVG